MNLEETLRKMKTEHPESFEPLIERMKRKAEKHLLENYSVEDIEYAVLNLEESENIEIIPEHTSTFNFTDKDEALAMRNISEMSEVENNFSSLMEYAYSDDEIENLILYKLCETIEPNFINEDLEEGAIIDSIKSAGKKALTFLSPASKYLKAAGLVGAGAAAGIGLYKLHKKRKERALSENIINLTNGILSNLSEDEINDLCSKDEDINYLITEARKNGFQQSEEDNEQYTYIAPDNKKYIYHNEEELKKLKSQYGNSESLKEAVTYIDNAGNLKTKLAVDYVKDMHKHENKTQIPDYKKKKNIDYKLISEQAELLDKQLSESEVNLNTTLEELLK